MVIREKRGLQLSSLFKFIAVFILVMIIAEVVLGLLYNFQMLNVQMTKADYANAQLQEYDRKLSEDQVIYLSNDELLEHKNELLQIAKEKNPAISDIQKIEMDKEYLNLKAVDETGIVTFYAYPSSEVLSKLPGLEKLNKAERKKAKKETANAAKSVEEFKKKVETREEAANRINKMRPITFLIKKFKSLT